MTHWAERLPGLVIAAAILALVGVTLFASWSQHASNGSFPWTGLVFRAARTDSEPIHVRLDGRNYCIPANYLEALLTPGVDQHDIMLAALLPDLEPKTGSNLDEFVNTPGWGRRMLIHVDTGLTDLQLVLEIALQTGVEFHGPMEQNGSLHGLTWHRPVGESAIRSRHDIFVHYEENIPSTYIQCLRDENLRRLACYHDFYHDGLYYTATYGRHLLKSWPEVQHGVAELLSGFLAEDNDVHDACTEREEGERQ